MKAIISISDHMINKYYHHFQTAYIILNISISSVYHLHYLYHRYIILFIYIIGISSSLSIFLLCHLNEEKYFLIYRWSKFYILISKRKMTV